MTLQLIYTQDVTVKWKDHVFGEKLMPAPEKREAYKKLKIGNMYVYLNTAMIDGSFHYYYTQTTEDVKGPHSITFLN